MCTCGYFISFHSLRTHICWFENPWWLLFSLLIGSPGESRLLASRFFLLPSEVNTMSYAFHSYQLAVAHHKHPTGVILSYFLSL
jgi:hypothetical protein